MKLNIIFKASVLLLLTNTAAIAQTTPNWAVKNLGKNINSEYHDGWSTITPDQLTLYFASNRPGGFVESNIEDTWVVTKQGQFTKYDMYVAHRKSINDAWGKPILLPKPINSDDNDHSAAQSEDGHYLFFASSRAGGCGELDLYVSYREDITNDLAWQTPKHLGCKEDGGINTEFIDSCPISYINKAGKHEIYYTAAKSPNPASLDFMSGSFNASKMSLSNPQTLNFSTDFLDGHIDPKFGYIWGGYPSSKGGSDILKATSKTKEGWQNPVNLGDSLNTKYEEQLPSPSADGKTIYFPSNRKGGHGGMDIYFATQVN